MKNINTEWINCAVTLEWRSKNIRRDTRCAEKSRSLKKHFQRPSRFPTFYLTIYLTYT